MMRRRPTAVYRVLDEEDLLSGADFIDPTAPWPVDEDLDPVDRDAPDVGRRWAGGGERRRCRGPRTGLSTGGGRSADAARPALRGRTLGGCAGALLLAVILTRAASVLLAGAGGATRGGRHPSGPRPAVARPAVVATGVTGQNSMIPGAPTAGGGLRRSAAPGIARRNPRSAGIPGRGVGRPPGARRSGTPGAPRPARADGVVSGSGRARGSNPAPDGEPRLHTPRSDRPDTGPAGVSPVGGPASSPGQEFGFER
jgi:hypothetical protein